MAGMAAFLWVVRLVNGEPEIESGNGSPLVPSDTVYLCETLREAQDRAAFLRRLAAPPAGPDPPPENLDLFAATDSYGR